MKNSIDQLFRTVSELGFLIDDMEVQVEVVKEEYYQSLLKLGDLSVKGKSKAVMQPYIEETLRLDQKQYAMHGALVSLKKIRDVFDEILEKEELL